MVRLLIYFLELLIVLGLSACGGAAYFSPFFPPPTGREDYSRFLFEVCVGILLLLLAILGIILGTVAWIAQSRVSNREQNWAYVMAALGMMPMIAFGGFLILKSL